MESLSGKFGLNIIRVNAQERFLSKLKGVSDPEQKRKIIGNEFVYVFDDEAAKLTDVDSLRKERFTQTSSNPERKQRKPSSLIIT